MKEQLSVGCSIRVVTTLITEHIDFTQVVAIVYMQQA